MKKLIWRIESFSGTQKLFATEIPAKFAGRKQMKELLSRLASRTLTENEIIHASVSNKERQTSLLEIREESKPSLTLTCGIDPYYIARITKS